MAFFERRFPKDADAENVPRDRNHLRTIAQVARDVVKDRRELRAPDPGRGRQLEDVIPLIRVERPELVAEHRFIVDGRRHPAVHVVDYVDFAAEMRVPREPLIGICERRRRQMEVVVREELRRGGRDCQGLLLRRRR